MITALSDMKPCMLMLSCPSTEEQDICPLQYKYCSYSDEGTVARAGKMEGLHQGGEGAATS